MEIKVESKAEQPLLARTVLHGRISFETSTPNREDVRKKLSDAIKADEALVQVTMIKTDYGQKSAAITAHLYKTKEDVSKYASVRVRNRHLSKEEKEKLKADKAKKPEGGK